MASRKSILVIGGAGELGQSVIRSFRNNSPSWTTTSLDFRSCESAEENIILNPNESWIDQIMNLDEKMKQKPTFQLDAVISTAGGWAGAKIGTREMLEQVDQMWHMNMHSAICASHLATNHLSPTGLVVLTGAQAIFPLRGSPSMAAYGLAKAATHQLVQTLSQSLELPGQTVVGLLPDTIDTATNRQAMPGACLSTWTPVDTIAREIVRWTNVVDDDDAHSSSRPATGSFQSIVTQEHKTTWTSVVL